MKNWKGKVKTIELTQGKVALVDDEDYEELSKHKWCVNKRGNTFYALRRSPAKNKSSSIHIQMQRAIMQTPDGFDVDHIDRNGLNNQKSNLRNCTHSQNLMNADKRKTNKSGYKGVSWCKTCNCWRADLKINSKQIFLGRYKNIMEAAIAYNEAAKKYHGKFAQLNKI